MTRDIRRVDAFEKHERGLSDSCAYYSESIFSTGASSNLWKSPQYRLLNCDRYGRPL